MEIPVEAAQSQVGETRLRLADHRTGHLHVTFSPQDPVMHYELILIFEHTHRDPQLDRNPRLAFDMELIRIRGHLTLWGGGIHHAEIKTAVRAGVPAPDG